MRHADSEIAVGCLTRRGLSCCVIAAAVSIAACSEKERFTGIWKSHCNDYWGVQIQPAGGGLYSVTFCGLSGCLKRGEWMPNTRIEGDPAYEVTATDALRVKRRDRGYFPYSRCSTDPSWTVASPR